MFDHLDAEIATALALEAATSQRNVEHARRRRAILGTLGLTVTAALTMVAAIGFSDERDPVVAAEPLVTTVTAPAPPTTPPPAPAAPGPPATVVIVVPPAAPPATAPPATAPPVTAPPATPPPTAATAPPEPTALEWAVTAPPEAESSEEPHPVTLTVSNPTASRQQYTAIVCDRPRRVTQLPGNVLAVDTGGEGCETTLQFVEPGGVVTWVQPVRLRTGGGRIPPGDYTLSLFGLSLPVRIVSPA